jgi:hypothetical protein
MLSYRPTGKISQGRPRKRWMSQMWGVATDESPMHDDEEEDSEHRGEIWWTLALYASFTVDPPILAS